MADQEKTIETTETVEETKTAKKSTAKTAKKSTAKTTNKPAASSTASAPQPVVEPTTTPAKKKNKKPLVIPRFQSRRR